jgi:hypothetical protein
MHARAYVCSCAWARACVRERERGGGLIRSECAAAGASLKLSTWHVLRCAVVRGMWLCVGQVVGFAARHDATGDPKGRTATENFFRMLTGHHSFTTGGRKQTVTGPTAWMRQEPNGVAVLGLAQPSPLQESV